MTPFERPTLTRRLVTKVGLAAGAPLALAALGHRVLDDRTAGAALTQADEPTPTPVLVPTPACADDDDLDATLEQTEGPFFTADSPERTSLLEPDLPGTRLVVAGNVVATDCRPIAGALLEFWQADDNGEYDNVGYRLRGHQFADDEGRFQVETIVPGLYPGRTRHIHVKVQAPDQPVLTTQLYFPDEPANADDGIFHPDLVIELEDATDADDGKIGRFTFVLDVT